MRAALCFSGRATKGCEGTLDNIRRNCIEPLEELGYKVDIFAHFWKIQDWEKALEVLKPTKFSVHKDYAERLNTEFERQWTKGELPTLYPYALSMFRSIFLANQLKVSVELKENFKYNLVARMRTDNVFTEGSYKAELKKCLSVEPMDILFPRNYKMKGKVPSNNYWYIVDNFAIGGSKAMDCYADTYCNIKEILENAKEDWSEKESWACGTILGSALVQAGVNNRLDLEPGPTVVRTWDSFLRRQVSRGNKINETAKGWIEWRHKLGLDDWSFSGNRS